MSEAQQRVYSQLISAIAEWERAHGIEPYGVQSRLRSRVEWRAGVRQNGRRST